MQRGSRHPVHRTVYYDSFSARVGRVREDVRKRWILIDIIDVIRMRAGRDTGVAKLGGASNTFEALPDNQAALEICGRLSTSHHLLPVRRMKRACHENRGAIPGDTSNVHRCRMGGGIQVGLSSS